VVVMVMVVVMVIVIVMIIVMYVQTVLPFREPWMASISVS
jgi:hypothetical protein